MYTWTVHWVGFIWFSYLETFPVETCWMFVSLTWLFVTFNTILIVKWDVNPPQKKKKDYRDCQLYNMCRGLLVWRVFVTFIIRRSREVQSVTPNLKDNALSPFGFSILFNRKIKFTFTFTIGRHCQSWSSLSPPLQSNSNFRLELQQQEVKARSDNFESQFWKILRKQLHFIISFWLRVVLICIRPRSDLIVYVCQWLTNSRPFKIWMISQLLMESNIEASWD